MKVKLKKLNDLAKMPIKAYEHDAGFDLYAASIQQEVDFVIYGTGLAFEIPEGYVGLIFPRSSIQKTCLSLTNSIGVIDAGYRGEVMLKFRRHNDYRALIAEGKGSKYNVGDRICQMIIIPIPTVELEFSDTLSDSERGVGGYGSSGK